MNRPLFSSSLASLTGLALVFSLAGCSRPTDPDANGNGKPAKEGPNSQAPAALATGPNAGKKLYGTPLDNKTPEVTLTEVLASPSKFADKNVRLSGKITAVCQGMGCWLQLGDEKGTAHVKLRGHSFFVPKTSSGKSAVVEARVMPAPDEGHCEEEAKEQTGVVAKVELEASGVEIF